MFKIFLKSGEYAICEDSYALGGFSALSYDPLPLELRRVYDNIEAVKHTLAKFFYVPSDGFEVDSEDATIIGDFLVDEDVNFVDKTSILYENWVKGVRILYNLHIHLDFEVMMHIKKPYTKHLLSL